MEGGASHASMAAAEGTESGGGRRLTQDTDDLLAGYVVVAPSSVERRSSPFSSPVLRTVQEGSEASRVVSPTIPQALPEETFTSPHRRGTPTTSSSRRRQRHQVTYEDLAHRPRSNPRQRTPMRYESPLEHSHFRRNETEESPEENVHEARRITIRPMAGSAPGVVARAPERVRFDDSNRRPEPITLKSHKQGPSKRKTNRWNNDNMGNAASELANASSSKSRIAAEVLSKAKADARHFLPVYDPNEKKRSDKVSRFMEDKKYSDIRDKFFSGELHATKDGLSSESHGRKHVNLLNPSADDLFHRIDGRLRRVLVKACENSAPACKIVESFEVFLVSTFSNLKPDSDVTSSDGSVFWEDVLVKEPSVSRDVDGTTSVTFLFDGESSKGGFHRILVHAVSHFHCLKAKTYSTDNHRVLTVTGTARGDKIRLLDYLGTLQEKRQ